MEPKIPAESDPIRTAILPHERRCSVYCGKSENERVSTKMLIVNPIPPRHATANSIFHDAFDGIAPIFHLMAMKLASEIPIGLPSSRPKNTPIPTEPISGLYWNILK